MTAATAPRSPSLAQVMNTALRAALQEAHMGMPARVEKVDLDKQLVDVQPLLKNVYFDEEGNLVSAQYPVIQSRRLEFPGGGGYRVTFPVAVGDTVWLKNASASLDEWQSSGGLVDPKDVRRFHLHDCVAVPGLQSNKAPWSGVSDSAITIGKDGGPQVVLKASEIHLGATATDAATEAVLLGTTYTADEQQMLQDVEQQLQTAATDVIQASAFLATASGQNAVPIYGGAMALSGFINCVKSLASVGADLLQAAAKIGVFVAKDSTHRSSTVKTK